MGNRRKQVGYNIIYLNRHIYYDGFFYSTYLLLINNQTEILSKSSNCINMLQVTDTCSINDQMSLVAMFLAKESTPTEIRALPVTIIFYSPLSITNH